jgi:TRAP-type C4-dicarboxylate transport system substrate-binding protein
MDESAGRITLLVFIFVLLWLMFSGSASAQTRIRLATLAPRGTVYHQALQVMAEKWKQAPGGGAQLTIYTDGTMGTEPEMIRRMRIGQIQAALITTIGMAEIDHSVTALQDMPMMFRDMDEVGYVREQLRPELERRLADKGFVVLGWGDTGWVRFFSKRGATRPDDFKSMKMFATASDQNQIEIMKSAGYRPVPLEWTDALTSLQTGMVEAIPTAPIVALGGQYYTVANHMLEVNWAPLVGGLVMTKKAWDALPAASRDAIRKAAEEAGLEIQRRSRAEERDAVEAMKKRGLQVHPLTPQLEDEWRRTAAGFYPLIRGRIVPADMFDKVQTILAQYRAANGKGKGKAGKP